MLAEAFCASNDRVREAQSVLDEAQAERTRTLAAFAVTLGNDSSVAHLMGLHEREVRVARRTVGKDDARTMAAGLLAPPLESTRRPGEEEAPPPAAWQADVGNTPQGAAAADEIQLPHQRRGSVPPPVPGVAEAVASPGSGSGAAHGATAGFAVPEAQHVTSPTFGPGRSEAAQDAEAWSSSMDSVLVWSWQSGVDLQFVAGELGLDLRALLGRVQTLAAEGRLSLHATGPPEADTAGRHRRRQGGHPAEAFPNGPHLADAMSTFVASTPYY